MLGDISGKQAQQKIEAEKRLIEEKIAIEAKIKEAVAGTDEEDFISSDSAEEELADLDFASDSSSSPGDPDGGRWAALHNARHMRICTCT